MDPSYSSKCGNRLGLAVHVLRILLAAALSLMAMAMPALAAEPAIDAVVIKLRDGVVVDAAAGLPSDQRATLLTAMQAPFSHVGYTRDGALQLQLLNPLPLDAARAAVNRVRMLPQVLYANLVPPAPNVGADAAISRKTAPLQPPVPRLIVKFRDAAMSEAARRNEVLPKAELDRLSVLAGQPVNHERAMSGGAFVVRLFQALSVDQARLLAAFLALDPTIEYAEPDLLMQPLLVPNDPSYASQWHYMSPPAEMGGVNLPSAWNITTGAASVVVAVIDTGSLPLHPDLAGRFIGGYDFISDSRIANDGGGRDADASDPGDWITASENASGFFAGCGVSNSSFHGTHVAGTIGAATGNGTGVAGINWVSKILPARALGKCGGYLSDVADAIRWSAGVSVPGVPDNVNPARVLNLSLGGYACDANGQNCGCDTTSQNAINAALTANAVVVVAAGNSGADAVQSSPGNCNGVITVGATGRAGQRASYSNFGPLVEISAPGGADGQYVLSTLNNGATSPNPTGYNYVYYQGTSMATPHVAGIASLMLSRNPALTPSQVVSKIQTTARAFPTGTGRDCTTALCGAGIIDAGAAVIAAGGVTTSTTALTSTPNPATLGASVTFTATVTGMNPTGNVSFTEGGNPLAGCPSASLVGTTNTRTASCSTSTLAVGVHSIVANYSGDSANTSSNSAALSQVINTSPTTTTLTSVPNPAVFGAPVTLTATVTGTNPTGSVTFTEGGNPLAGCPAGTLSGTPRTASCSTSSLPVGSHSIIASYGGDSANAASASTALAQVVNDLGGSTNVALASAGAVASASSAFGGYPASGANNGDRKGLNWGGGGGWNDATGSAFPDWLQIDFSGTQTIGEIDVFSVQDSYAAPSDPTPTMTFTQYGLTDFQVQYWTGSAWADVPGGNVTGNNLVWRKVTFAPISTPRIRVLVNGALQGYSRIIEVEAWTAAGSSDTTPPTVPTNLSASAVTATGTTISWTASTDNVAVTGYKVFRNGAQVPGTVAGTSFSDTGLAPSTTYSYTVSAFDAAANNSAQSNPLPVTTTASPTVPVNVALASAGAVASASSAFSGYPASGANNGDRKGLSWGSGGGWNDATGSAFPDWLQIDFSGTQTIGEIDVFSVQDSYAAPSDPTPTMTFTQYGLTDFQVQYWTGSAWADVPGGNVTGNNLVWRKVTFAPISTPRIRVLVNGALQGYSRIIEVEAWTAAGSSDTTPPTVPTNLSASAVTATGTTISWTASTDNVAVTGYKVFRNGTQVPGTVAGTSFSDTGLAPSTTYSYTVSAFDAAANNSAQSNPLPVTTTAGPTVPVNVALQVNGGIATASSAFGGYPASGANNGDRKGLNWGGGGGWNDATGSAFPDWLQIDFSGTQTIGEIDVFSVQDSYAAPSDPTPTMTFTQYGLTDFQVQYWTGSAWADVPGGNVTGNNLVWRKVTFAPISTPRIRVLVNGALQGYSRIIEVEAWTAAGSSDTTPPTVPTNLSASAVTATGTTISWTASTDNVAVTGYKVFRNGAQVPGTVAGTSFSDTGLAPSTTYSYTVSAFDAAANNSAQSNPLPVTTTASPTVPVNVALASAGAVASASSAFSGYPASGANNGDRKGLSWGSGGGWNDATGSAFPDWLQIDFSGTQTIGEIDVFSVQDSYAAPSDPTPTMTFTQYGLTDFQVQYWTGSAWADVPGGNVTGNNLVWRKVTFAPISTPRIRVLVNGALQGYSRIIEVEAWTGGP